MTLDFANIKTSSLLFMDVLTAAVWEIRPENRSHCKSTFLNCQKFTLWMVQGILTPLNCTLNNNLTEISQEQQIQD